LLSFQASANLQISALPDAPLSLHMWPVIYMLSSNPSMQTDLNLLLTGR